MLVRQPDAHDAHQPKENREGGGRDANGETPENKKENENEKTLENQ